MTKVKMQALSPAESEILAVIWRLEQATVQEVIDHLPSHKETVYTTIQTLIRRLEKKGYLKHRSLGKAHQYYACVKKDDVISRAVNDFVNRLFGGDPAPLLMHMAEKGDICPEDLEKLQKLVTKTRS
ncbi:MAG: BlaI/MecI/CopY family transcriptional regulator [Planctomycetes bacterium]|nr:BlaI/MecI/CopY family transcriptional regulator [Planctomycetota bacterium]